MLDMNWFQCLSGEFRWLQDHQHNPDLLEVINRILNSEDYHDITDAYQSSVWAVCHAYIDYRLGTSFLSTEEMDYTRGRSGVIGIHMENGNATVATLRHFLEEHDPGFEFFMTRQHCGPPAA
jgi:hypothetical protein